MSPFEEVFGRLPHSFPTSEEYEDDLSYFIAKIRDDHLELLKKYNEWSSIMSDPTCVLYAIYKALDELQQKETENETSECR